MVDHVLAQPEESAWMLLAPVIQGRKGEHLALLEEIRSQGFVRLRIDGEVHDIEDLPSLNPKTKHDIDVVVDRFKVRAEHQQRLAESFETALRLADGVARVAPMKGEAETLTFSAKFACHLCGYSLNELEPRLFSFNSPHGACNACDGLGIQSIFDPIDQPVVRGTVICEYGGPVRRGSYRR